MGHNNKPKIDSEDLYLLKIVAKYGFVDTIFIRRFYKTNCKAETVYRRIKQLVRHQWLYEESLFVPPDYRADTRESYAAYCLGSVGLDYFRFQGMEIPNYISTLGKAAPYRVYHQVQVATVCESIEQAYKNRTEGTLEVAEILSEREATLKDRENQPDALVLFKRKNGQPGLIAIFIEVERSYARWNRIASKLAAYRDSFQLKKYQEELKLPIIASRLLFIAQTSGQYETLRKKVSMCKESKEIEVLLVKYEDVCNCTLEKVYFLPDDSDDNFHLLETLNK